MQAGELEQAALRYLGRYEASAKGVAAVLQRRIRRKYPDSETTEERQKALALIPEIIEKLTRLGYLNDVRFAENRRDSLLRQGKSIRKIGDTLAQKGISSESRRTVLQESADSDLRAALIFCRKKRIGPFAPDSQSPEDSTRQHHRLLRQGFTGKTLRQLLPLDLAQAESLLDSLRDGS